MRTSGDSRLLRQRRLPSNRRQWAEQREKGEVAVGERDGAAAQHRRERTARHSSVSAQSEGQNTQGGNRGTEEVAQLRLSRNSPSHACTAAASPSHLITSHHRHIRMGHPPTSSPPRPPRSTLPLISHRSLCSSLSSPSQLPPHPQHPSARHPPPPPALSLVERLGNCA